MRGLACALMLLAQPAAALSCLRPTVERSYAEAVARGVEVVALYGVLEFDPAALPQSYEASEPAPAPVPARFTGRQVLADGLAPEISVAVTVQPVCFGPWCGGLTPGERHLFFADDVAGGVIFPANPCGTTAFASPTQGQLATVQACMARSGSCTLE